MNKFLDDYSSLLGLVIAFISMMAGLLAVYHFRVSRRKEREEEFIHSFVNIRTFIKENRKALQQKAVDEYNTLRPRSLVYENHLFARPGWMPDKLLPLDTVVLKMAEDIRPWLTDGAAHRGDRGIQHAVRRPAVGHFDSYAEAIKATDRPGVFENNLQYRLLNVNNNELVFSQCEYSYFDKINFGGYLDYEQAVHILHGRKPSLKRAVIRGFSSPSDYIVLSGISTLTLIKEESGLRFLLHRRGTEETASAMNTMHVIPAGEFQPSCKAALSWNDDFDIWKNVLRETAEELLMVDEYPHVNKDPFNYKAEPYMTIEAERRAGNIRAYYLGVGLDPGTMQAEILTCVVYRESSFMKIFSHDDPGKILRSNREGEMIHEGDGRWGLEFNQKRVDSIINGNSLSACKALLEIAFRNRELLMNCFIETTETDKHSKF